MISETQAIAAANCGWSIVSVFVVVSITPPVTSPHKMGGHNNGKDACSHDTARNSATLLLSDTYIPLGPTGLNASLKCKIL